MKHQAAAHEFVAPVLLVTLFACSAESPQDSPCDPALVAPTSQATTAKGSPGALGLRSVKSNGVDFNGVDFNGVDFNGTLPNGLELNMRQNQGPLPTGTGFLGVKLGALTLKEGVLTDASRTGETSEASLVGVFTNAETVPIVARALGTAEHAPGVHLYTVEYQGRNLCGESGRGVFVPGVWDGSGARHASLRVGSEVVDATFSCTTGAIGKCVVWGYGPHRVGADVHQACTRMVRADYCGDGASHTKNGTLIDMFDAFGIQKPESPSMPFEAGWGKDGAICVQKPRYSTETADGTPFLPSCWKSKPTCTTWADAQSLGAALANGSSWATRRACH